MKIIRTFKVNALVDSEMFAVFFMNQGVVTVGTFENRCFAETAVRVRLKTGLTNFTKNLAFLPAIVPSQILNRSIAGITATVFGNVTFNTAEYGFDSFVVTLFIVRDKIFPVPFLLIGYDFGKLIHFELLVPWRVGIIKSPLLERDMSTDKI